MCRWPSTSWPLVQRSLGFLCRCTRSHNPLAGSAHCGSVRETPVCAQEECFITVTFQRRQANGDLCNRQHLQKMWPESKSYSSLNNVFMTWSNLKFQLFPLDLVLYLLKKCWSFCFQQEWDSSEWKKLREALLFWSNSNCRPWLLEPVRNQI